MSDVPPPPPMPAVLPGQEPFQTNKTLAIITIVVGALTCSCLTLILGIISVVFANKAQAQWSAGDAPGAASSASTARILAIIGFVLVVLWAIAAIVTFSTGGFRIGN